MIELSPFVLFAMLAVFQFSNSRRKRRAEKQERRGAGRQERYRDILEEFYS